MNRKEFTKKNLLFTWSDIYPDTPIPKETFEKSCIFTYGSQCRYLYSVDNTNGLSVIQKSPKGNIIGIYYLKDFKINSYTPKEDIIDVIGRNLDSADIGAKELVEIVDVGDTEKYKTQVQKTKRKFDCRFFNKICYKNSNSQNLVHKHDYSQKTTNNYNNYIQTQNRYLKLLFFVTSKLNSITKL